MHSCGGSRGSDPGNGCSLVIRRAAPTGALGPRIITGNGSLAPKRREPITGRHGAYRDGKGPCTCLTLQDRFWTVGATAAASSHLVYLYRFTTFLNIARFRYGGGQAE